MNSILLLAVGLCIPLLAIAILLIRRYTADKPNLMFNVTGKAILYASPVVGILVFLVLFALKSWNLMVLCSYLVIPMILGPLVFLVYSKKPPRGISLGDRAFRLLLILFFAGYALSVLLLNVYEVRPYAYYVIIAVIATVLMLEIMLFDGARRSTMTILLQVSMLALNIIWSINLKYFYYVGRSDILNHAYYAQIIVDLGHVTSAFFDYQPFPLWHILSGVLYMISGSNSAMHDFMFLLIGLIFLLIPLGIYLVVMRTAGDQRIALLSSLFISFYPYFSLVGSEALARSVVSALGIMLMLLLLDSKSKTRFALALLLTLGIVMFHTVGISFILLILGVTYVAQKVFVPDKKYAFLRARYFVAALAIVIVYWVIFARRLIDTLLYDILVMGPAPTAGTMTSIISTPVNELFNYIQFTPFVFFITVGIVFMLLSRKLGRTAILLGITTLVLIPITFPGPGSMISTFMANVEIERVFENGFLFMALAAGAGFTALFYRTGKVARTALVVLFAIMVLLSVSNDFVATDNPLVKRPFYTHYLTGQETNGLTRIANMSAGNVMSDFIYYKYLYNTPEAFKSIMIQASLPMQDFLKNYDSNLIVVRDMELEKRPLFLLGVNNSTYDDWPSWTDLAYYPKESVLWNDTANHSEVFDSGVMSVYC